MLTTEDSLLLIVDVQGKLAQIMDNREALFANLQRMVKGALTLNLPIVWAEQLPEKLGPTIPEIAELLTDYAPCAKSTFSCCANSELMGSIESIGRKQVLLVGIEAHICVYQTAADLLKQGYEVEVIADAVGSRMAENRLIGLNKMEKMGADIGCTEGALFELMHSATHPAFRNIQRIVK
ncbi:MAG: hydrolase [Aquabacterium sp.]|jgi:nicotinamidase-related amidase|nr:MAG: hydrolase [Aquabacterium sp.]